MADVNDGRQRNAAKYVAKFTVHSDPIVVLHQYTVRQEITAEEFGLSYETDILVSVSECLNNIVLKFVFTLTQIPFVAICLNLSNLFQQYCGCD